MFIAAENCKVDYDWYCMSIFSIWVKVDLRFVFGPCLLALWSKRGSSVFLSVYRRDLKPLVEVLVSCALDLGWTKVELLTKNGNMSVCVGVL